MFTFLRLHLALLPFLWSLWKDDAGNDSDDDGDATGTNGDTSDDAPAEKTYTHAQLQRQLAIQAKNQRDKIKAELEAESAKAKLEADGKLQELLETERREKAERDQRIADMEARERSRVLRYEIRDAARDLSFADPDDAYHLIDRDAVEYDDDGDPTNVARLVKALAEKKPHLVKAEGDGRRGIPATPRGQLPQPQTRDDIKNRYLEQAGIRSG